MLAEEEKARAGGQKPRLAASFERACLQSLWKEEQVDSSRTAGLPQGKAPRPPSSLFKEPLLDGRDPPNNNACDQQAETCQEKSESCGNHRDFLGFLSQFAPCTHLVELLYRQYESVTSLPGPLGAYVPCSGLPDAQLPFIKVLDVENEIMHPQRCAAITSDMCEMLLGEEVGYQGCMSSVAAFILEREVAESPGPCKETYELVALGTGDRCYEGWMEFSGRRVHDLHGLVVARRALLRYLYKQLLMYGSQDPATLEKCIFCPADDEVHLTLKPKYFLHLYLSQTPSGAAENFQSSLSLPSPSAGLHVSLKGVLKPVLYCRASVLSAYVHCVSGIDKLFRWSILGVQGALLSHIIHPMYITSIILADHYQDSALLSRIIDERLQLVPRDDMPAPYGHKQVHIFEGPRVAPLDTPPECRSLSLNWCGGDEMLELVNGTVGMAVRNITSPGNQYRPSRLCKAAMLKYFRKVAQEMNREDLASLPTYHEAKVQAEVYQRAKLQMYNQLSRQDFGKWPQKPLVDRFAS